MPTLPNFFIAGAPKTGTTSLYHYLSQHSQIYMSPVKEPNYFNASELLDPSLPPQRRRAVERNMALVREFIRGPMDQRLSVGLALDWETYLELFRNVRGETAVGEASTGYLGSPVAAAAIHSRVPAARLIFILRDPAERLFSQYLEAIWHEPERSFRRRFQGAIAGTDIWAISLRENRYATNLERFFRYFPPEQIRVYLYEDYRANPRALLHDILAFLGVRADETIDMSKRWNQPAVPRFPRLHTLRMKLLGSVPLLSLLPGSIRRFVLRAYQRPQHDLVLDAADRKTVIDYYRDEIMRTSEIIGRDLSAWLR